MNLKEKMNDVLRDLGLEAECVNAQRNRHLAFFDLKLSNKTRVRKLEMFSHEISLALHAKDKPFITPIYSKGVVRLRFAMDDATTIDFNDLFVKNCSDMPDGMLQFLIGETEEGTPMWLDIASNPHMLVAGSTGSGKSTLLHILIANALRRNDIDVMLVDPKFGVEFSRYEDRADVARDYDEAILFLKILHQTMNERYKKMATLGVSSLEQKPTLFKKKLLIVDEVADLMIYDADKGNPNKGMFETLLCSIAQKARACGIYMIIATQRPSVDVITGVIKANFPARLACKVSTAVDSKVILDRIGAESLLGRGDAIINNSKNNDVRFQVAYIDLSNA